MAGLWQLPTFLTSIWAQFPSRPYLQFCPLLFLCLPRWGYSGASLAVVLNLSNVTSLQEARRCRSGGVELSTTCPIELLNTRKLCISQRRSVQKRGTASSHACALDHTHAATTHSPSPRFVSLQVTQTFLRISKRLGSSVDAMQVRVAPA